MTRIRTSTMCRRSFRSLLVLALSTSFVLVPQRISVAASTAPVEQTGQVTCYDSSGLVVSNPDKGRFHHAWPARGEMEPPVGGDLSSVILPLVGGVLSASSRNVIFPETILAGQDALVLANDATWTANDTTGLGSGWHLTLVANDHLRGVGDADRRVILVGENEEFRVSCLDAEIVPFGDAGIPPTCPTGAQPIPRIGEDPLSILYANPGQGMGIFDFVPHFEVLVPGTAIIDTYRTEIWIDIIAGP